MSENLRDITTLLTRTSGGMDFIHNRLRGGNYRQLFDNLASEWNDSSLPEKKAIIEEIEKLGITRERLKEAFKISYRDRPDIVMVADMSLKMIELQSMIGWEA